MKPRVVLPLLFSVVAMAQSAGTFTATGNMTTVRYGATATLLPNGKVLIAGGQGADKLLSSTELYDPSTGIFTATGGIVANPFGPFGTPNAVVLADGRVLTAGELYDPATGTFSATAAGGDWTVGTLLNDGCVLFANNFSAALYDPASGTLRFTGAPDPNVLYEDAFAMAPLTNGKVLLAGGISEEFNLFSAGAELNDPLTGIFARTGDMATGRAYHTATTLGDGTVLIAGSSAITSSSAELYDPVTGTFSRTGNLTMGRREGTPSHCCSMGQS